jgi:hypothetical protein
MRTAQRGELLLGLEQVHEGAVGHEGQGKAARQREGPQIALHELHLALEGAQGLELVPAHIEHRLGQIDAQHPHPRHGGGDPDAAAPAAQIEQGAAVAQRLAHVELRLAGQAGVDQIVPGGPGIVLGHERTSGRPWRRRSNRRLHSRRGPSPPMAAPIHALGVCATSTRR